jgi:alpha-aminoadipic semialdehyde synthase
MEQDKIYIGIRKETKTDEEKRVALPPCSIASLLSSHSNLVFLVQPSPHRIFPESDYLQAGAIIQQDLSQCSLIIGVKELTQQYLDKHKTYLCFPHVIKA